MDVKAKVDEINARCETDESFRTLLKEDMPAALKQCGVDSPDEFMREVADGTLSDSDLGSVAGGTEDDYSGGSWKSSYFGNAWNDWRRKNGRY